MNKGTIVYLCWYDFQKQTEHTCKGEVVDNSLWTGTKQADMINVRFQPPGMPAPICHHFPADKLSTDAANVPHDECYLVCGKKSRFMEHDTTLRLKKSGKRNTSDAWQLVQQFKQEHWDYEHGHLAVDSLDEFYRLWYDAIAIKRGLTSLSVAPAPSPVTASPPVLHVEASPQPSQPSKLTVKQKRSTGRIQFKDAIQTSLFD